MQPDQPILCSVQRSKHLLGRCAGMDRDDGIVLAEVHCRFSGFGSQQYPFVFAEWAQGRAGLF